MASKTQICNLALTRLAAARITDISDGTQTAQNCNAIYDLIAEEVMAFGPWTSCVRRVALAQLATTPAFEYSYEYALPTNPKFLRLIRVNESKNGEIDFRLEGNKLLTNESAISIQYIAFVSDPNSYDIDLQQAIVDRLVAELVYKETGSLSAYQASLEYYRKHAAELLSQNTIQQPAIDVNSDSFIDARLGSWPNEGRLRD